MKIKLTKQQLMYLIPIAALFILPVFLGGNPHIMQIMTMCLIWAVVAAAWDLVMGYGGIFSFGQIAFFAIGAYTTSLVTKTGPNTLDSGMSPWAGLIVGGLAAAAVGFLISIPAMKLRGAYVALLTFALHETLPPLIRAGQPIGTGGVGSLVGIPPFVLGSYTFTPIERVPSYYVALGIFCALIFLVYKVINSRFGLAFVALRDSESFGKSLGINIQRSNILLFTISAFISGVMGAFYAHYLGLISHQVLGLDIFVLVLVMVTVGGLGRFPGSIIAAFIFTFANELLRPLEAFRAIVLGSIIISVIVLSPRGIMGIPDMIKAFLRRGKKSVTAEATKT